MRASTLCLVVSLAGTCSLIPAGCSESGQALDDTGSPPADLGQEVGDGGDLPLETGPGTPCEAEPGPTFRDLTPTYLPAFRGATNLGLAGDDDITNRTGENPTVSTWDGRVIVRRCGDPEGVEYAEPATDGQPGVLLKQYWCFYAFRPARVTVDDATGVPDFSDAFGPGFMSTTRHVSHTGGFPIVENESPAARWNPYPSSADGVACGAASLEESPPPCPEQAYATYDLYIVHTVNPSNPTLDTDYPDWPGGEGFPTYFEQMLIVVRDPETVRAAVADVLRDSTPYPMVADPDGFGFVYDPDDPSVRNPYLHRSDDDPDTTYIGGSVTIEPGATNDGRMVIFNGGDENPFGIDLIYTWNPTPAAQTGWSPPKNLAYMYYVEGPGAPGGETPITIDGVDYPFSQVFPIARQPLRDQEGVVYNPGTTYVPAMHNPDPDGYPYAFDTTVSREQYLGAYPWISWDGRNVMSLSNGRFNVTVVGDLTGYAMYAIDGGIDRTDFVGQEPHQISAMWNLGQWPGRWAQYALELEGRPRTVPTRVRDAVTWAIFEQDHYSEISFHKTDGSYARYYPMSRLRERGGPLYLDGATPDVSGRFDTGTLVSAGGQIGFSQRFSDTGYVAEPLTRVLGFSGNSVGFLTDASDPDVAPHIAADAVTGIDRSLTVEAAVSLQTGGDLPAEPWATLVRQPGAFALGVDSAQRPWFEVTDTDGEVARVTAGDALDDNTWVHLAGVYNGAELRLYVDARPVAVEPGTGRDVHASAEDFAVGPANDGTDPGGDGLVRIDEVGVSPSVRTLDEIAHDAFQRLRRPTASLTEWDRLWGTGSMPLGLVDEDGTLLAPIHFDYEVTGDVDAAVRLGDRLFHESALSTTDPPISCASCHALTQEDGGARHGETISTRGAGTITRHTPTVLNRVFGRRQFWDGRAGSLEDQLLFPIAAPNEMAMPLDELTDSVLPELGYAEDFCAAFGSSDTTLEGVQEALVFYESGLVAGDSAVDRHRLLGEPLSESAERGLALFETQGRCIGCHPPPLYADGRFHDNAQGNNDDPGREYYTTHQSDLGRFRTMSLRDVDRTPPYMHDGSVATLREVLERYNAGGDGSVDEMKPLGLTPAELNDLAAFLEALRSEQQVIPLE